MHPAQVVRIYALDTTRLFAAKRTVMRKMLVTGASGLIGSEVVTFFCNDGLEVHGVDNNMRKDFFGPPGDTSWNRDRLVKSYKNFRIHEIDIRDRSELLGLIGSVKPDAVIHAAAQPSHDLAASRPFDDFDVNAVGTLNLLEATRRVCPESPFIHMSTNKVYGDAPQPAEPGRKRNPVGVR